jgi:hypothetical protein
MLQSLCRFEQLEAYARSMPPGLPFHQLLSSFADSARLSEPYFLADMANMVALARVLRHLEAAPVLHANTSAASDAAGGSGSRFGAADDVDSSGNSYEGGFVKRGVYGQWVGGQGDDGEYGGGGGDGAAAGLDLEDMFTWCTAPASADDPAVLQVSKRKHWNCWLLLI